MKTNQYVEKMKNIILTWAKHNNKFNDFSEKRSFLYKTPLKANLDSFVEEARSILKVPIIQMSNKDLKNIMIQSIMLNGGNEVLAIRAASKVYPLDVLALSIPKHNSHYYTNKYKDDLIIIVDDAVLQNWYMVDIYETYDFETVITSILRHESRHVHQYKVLRKYFKEKYETIFPKLTTDMFYKSYIANPLEIDAMIYQYYGISMEKKKFIKMINKTLEINSVEKTLKKA